MSTPRDKLQARSRSEACERLARSRERLREALRPAGPASAAGSGTFDWASAFKSVPGAPALIQALRQALGALWANNPVGGAARLAAAAAASMLRPLARRRPLALVLGAAAVGAALMASRPWRWAPRALLRSGMWAGLPGLMAAVVARWPVQTWLDVLSEALRHPTASPSAAPQPEPAPAPQPMPTPPATPGS
jgi:hypothetical protein